MPATQNQILDALLLYRLTGFASARWNFTLADGTQLNAPGGIGQGVALTYSLPATLPAYDVTAPPQYSDFTTTTAAQRTAALAVFTQYQEVTKLTFSLSATSGLSNIAIGQYSVGFPENSDGHAYLPVFDYTLSGSTIGNVTEGALAGAQGYAGDVWILKNRFTDGDFSSGGSGYELLLHEIGHAVGLIHPFEGSVVLPADLDHKGFTVMSYTHAPHSMAVTVTGTAQSFSVSWQNLVPRTLMVGDMLALQYTYGANNNTATGNNTYTWSANERFYETIWDAGGTDTIDASIQTLASVINLTPGSYSSIGFRQTHAELYIDIPSFAAPSVSLSDSVLYNGQNNLGIAYGANIENAIGGSGNDTLTGNTLANQLTGNGGDDTLDGGAGADTMAGGNGNDAYSVDNAGEVVTENPGEGTWDYINAYVNHTLEANVEAMLMFNGAAGTGNAADNALYGNFDAAANLLAGGAGNDIYNVGAGDSIVENPGEGSWDFINAYASRTLEANVEAMIMLNGANGTGNAQDNALYGNYDGAANTLTGGDGNDIYSVGAGDVVVEAAGATAGTWDFINAYVSRSLELNVEAMIMLSGASGTGNAQDNALYGNYDAAANVLTGLDGNDTYVLGAGDSVVETPTGGAWDFLVTYATHTLEANVEAMILDSGANGFGNAGDNALYGNFDAAANVLTGGAGNDVYNVGAGDAVAENPGEGSWDFIFAFAAHTLEANVEALIMLNGAAGTGNAQANTLYGNWDGAANLLVGGDGDDTFVVSAGDTVQESANQGTDTVVAFVSFTLPGEVENLSMSGTDPINATGNSVANLILGNGADNTLTSKGGNDRLFGGGGVDRFVFDTAPNAATNVDVITDFTPGTDKIVLDHLIFTHLVAGTLPAGQLVTGNGAFSTQADDFLVYDSGGGNLFYDAGGAGGAAPVWIAHLDNNPTLTAADFSVV